MHRREHRRHRVVHPDIDGTEFVLHLVRRRFHRRVVGDVGRDADRAHAHAAQFCHRRGEPIGIA
jgi:hypothetical protein